MKYSLAFVIYLLSAVRSCYIEKIRSDPVQEIEFDDDLNTYVIILFESKPWMSALNRENEVLFTMSQGPGKSYFVTNEEGMYVYHFLEPDGDPARGKFIKYNKGITSFGYYNKATCRNTNNFMDEESNVFINTAGGVSLIRYYTKAHILIKNLEDYTFSHHVEDEEDNVYLASDEVDSLFVVTKEGKHSSKPYAKKISDSSGKPIIKFVKSYNDRVMAVYKTENLTVEVKNLTENEVNTMALTDFPSKHYGHFFSTGTALFFTSVDENDVTRFHMVKKSRFSSTIPLIDIHFDRKKEIIVVDSENNAFIAYNEELLFVRPDVNHSPNPIKIRMPNNESIDSLAVDDQDRIWILAKNLYVLLREFNFIMKVSNLSFAGIGDALPVLKVKDVTQEIYIGSNSGLYICTKDQDNKNKTAEIRKIFFPKTLEEFQLSFRSFLFSNGTD